MPTLKMSLLPNPVALVFVCLLAFVAVDARAQSRRARAVKVIDGDSVHIVLVADHSYHICRLIGIDAPEPDIIRDGVVIARGQPLGRAATEYLTYLLRDTVRVRFHGRDVYSRSLCWLEGPRGSINAEMVRAGFAEVYHGPGENPYRAQLDPLEREARLARRGIWRLPDYESPAEFRWRRKEQEAAR